MAKPKASSDSRPHNKYIPVPQTRSREHSKPKMVNREPIKNISRDIAPYPDTIYRPPPKPTEIPLKETLRKLMDLDTNINTDFEENVPYQEGIISETYQRPDRSFIRLLSLFEYILEDSGSAENKEELLFSHDKLSLASILRLLHQVTKEMLVIITFP